MPKFLHAKLILENGLVFSGVSFGHEDCTAGEVVFNTGMVGYPLSMTDPSYKGQILCFTYPLVGNYGVPGKEKRDGLLENFESERIQIQGLVVSDYSYKYSHWKAKRSLQEWLVEEKVPAITGVDTRALTQVLREKGTMLGKIVLQGKEEDGEKIKLEDPNERNLVADVSCDKVVEYGNGNGKEKKRIALMDCGAKNNIIRCLLKRGVSVLRVPWDYDIFEKNEKFDALLVSNGPGDPKKADKTIAIVKKAIEAKVPSFGICLGTQIMALAVGADTYKLKYGHRSQNQPCRLNGTSKAFVTSQNHGFAVDGKSLPEDWGEWFVNLNDGTVEGIRHKSNKFLSTQFHPESCPGPTDTEFIFDKFIEIIEEDTK